MILSATKATGWLSAPLHHHTSNASTYSVFYFSKPLYCPSLPFSHVYVALLFKGEYLVRNTTNSEQMVYSVILKLHVSAFIGHLQVSTIL